jgi:hypothetical protein
MILTNAATHIHRYSILIRSLVKRAIILHPKTVSDLLFTSQPREERVVVDERGPERGVPVYVVGYSHGGLRYL